MGTQPKEGSSAMRRFETSKWLSWIAVATALIVLGATAGSARPAATSSSNGKSLGSVVVGVGSDAGYAGLVAAVALNQFKKQNVNASLRVFASGLEAQQAMLAGDVDITLSSEVFPNLTKAQGGNIYVVAEANTATRQIALVAKSGIKQPSDLIGKNIGYTQGISPEFMMLRYLAKYHIKQSQVHLQNIAVNNIVPLFARGDIDAFFTINPHPAEALAVVPGSHIMAWNGAVNYEVTDFYDFGAKLGSNPALARACMRALISTEKIILSGPKGMARVKAAVVKALQLDQKTVDAGMAVWNWRIQLTPTSLKKVEGIGGWLRANGRIPAGPPNGLSWPRYWKAFFSPQFLKAVDPTRVTLK
jgi:ABC-type nitrate/sulfonate/bicarbonate transport system substrate-binding protein